MENFLFFNVENDGKGYYVEKYYQLNSKTKVKLVIHFNLTACIGAEIYAMNVDMLNWSKIISLNPDKINAFKDKKFNSYLEKSEKIGNKEEFISEILEKDFDQLKEIAKTLIL